MQTKLLALIVLLLMHTSTPAQQSLRGIRLQDTDSNVVTINSPATGFNNNYNFRFPASTPGTGSLIYANDLNGQLSWMPPSEVNGAFLVYYNGVPTWSHPQLLEFWCWSVIGNTFTTAYNGSTGNYIGTNTATPFVLATTDTTAGGQPIEFFTKRIERARLTASGELLIGTATPLSPAAKLHVNGSSHGTYSVTSSVTDEQYGVHGEASASSTNQVIGIWGDASNTGSTNTATIGVLATGNGNTTASQTNIALQVSDGSIAVGRTTEAPGTGTAVEAAAAGTNYTQQGPSGVIELSPFSADQVLAAGSILSWVDHITVNNRYVTSTSIIHVQVLNTADGTSSQVAGAFNTANATFTSLVDNRQTGSFQLSIAQLAHASMTIDGGSSTSDRDLIRIGYTIINPAK